MIIHKRKKLIGMDYQIKNGPAFTTLHVKMSSGETFRAELERDCHVSHIEMVSIVL